MVKAHPASVKVILVLFSDRENLLGVELAGGLSDVLLRELWKLACYWRVHGVKADFQSTAPHKNKTHGPTATSHPSYDDPTVATST